MSDFSPEELAKLQKAVADLMPAKPLEERLADLQKRVDNTRTRAINDHQDRRLLLEEIRVLSDFVKAGRRWVYIEAEGVVRTKLGALVQRRVVSAIEGYIANELASLEEALR